jgi:hypothetical protein
MSESDARTVTFRNTVSRKPEPLELRWAPAPRGELPVAAPVCPRRPRNLTADQKRMKKIRALLQQHFTARPAIEPYCKLVDAAHMKLPRRLRDIPNGPNSYQEVLKLRKFRQYRKNIEAEISRSWKPLQPG